MKGLRQNTKCVKQLNVRGPQLWVSVRVFTLTDLGNYCWPTPLFMRAIDQYDGRGTS